MALTDFFRINLPYGLLKNAAGEWFVFNRERMPLGWNNEALKSELIGDGTFPSLPVQTEYKGLTDTAIRKFIKNSELIELDENGKIKRFWLYDGKTNPTFDSESWPGYFEKLKALSKFAVPFEVYN